MKVLVTGASGFLGRYLVDLLLGRGYLVHTLCRHEDSRLASAGITQFCGDVADAAAVRTAAQGCSAIFHVAAKAGFWGNLQDYTNSNVKGTVNVIAACRSCGIRYLIYTSSPSVVFDGRHQRRVDESMPYPRRFLAHYPRTKAQAEELALSANGHELHTVALRPHLIWGPRDNHIIPRLVDRAKRNKLVLIGKGTNLIDAVYVENAALAHLNALDALMANGEGIGGRAYFITNHEPMPLAELVGKILAAHGMDGSHIRYVPYALAYGLGLMLELIYGTLHLKGEPRITRFVAQELATDHHYDYTRAQNDLGYMPVVSMAEGLAKLRNYTLIAKGS